MAHRAATAWSKARPGGRGEDRNPRERHPGAPQPGRAPAPYRRDHRARILTCPDAYTTRGRRPKGEDHPPRHSFAACTVCRDVTPHVLRASRITHMLVDRVPLAEVQAFADHDNPATTVGYWNRRNTATRNAQLVDEGAAIFTARRNM